MRRYLAPSRWHARARVQVKGYRCASRRLQEELSTRTSRTIVLSRRIRGGGGGRERGFRESSLSFCFRSPGSPDPSAGAGTTSAAGRQGGRWCRLLSVSLAGGTPAARPTTGAGSRCWPVQQAAEKEARRTRCALYATDRSLRGHPGGRQGIHMPRSRSTLVQ